MSTESAAGTQDIVDLSYEEARDELVSIVSRIEGGSASLEESMTLWERGEALAAHCKAKLDQAQVQLDRGTAGAGGASAGADGAAGDDSGEGDSDGDDSVEDDSVGDTSDDSTEGNDADG